MKKTAIILSLFALLACNCKLNKRQIVSETAITPESYYNFDTIWQVGKQEFHFTSFDPDFENSDTLLISVKTNMSPNFTALTDYVYKDGLVDAHFQDFNQDGYPDIWLYYADQAGDHILYLFNPEQNKFVKSLGFERLREPMQLKSNFNYYYTYSRAGCADMNWTSKLFVFKNFETIELGYIYGKGCDDEDNEEQGIEIYQVIDNDETKLKLIQQLPYDIDNYEKWDFIKNYWETNYQNFE